VGLQELNHFEHSLEVWRQLWRVVEKSHILLVLLDR
jgi:ribosome biogenesis GTPase A